MVTLAAPAAAVQPHPFPTHRMIVLKGGNPQQAPSASTNLHVVKRRVITRTFYAWMRPLQRCLSYHMATVTSSAKQRSAPQRWMRSQALLTRIPLLCSLHPYYAQGRRQYLSHCMRHQTCLPAWAILADHVSPFSDLLSASLAYRMPQRRPHIRLYQHCMIQTLPSHRPQPQKGDSEKVNASLISPTTMYANLALKKP